MYISKGGHYFIIQASFIKIWMGRQCRGFK